MTDQAKRNGNGTLARQIIAAVRDMSTEKLLLVIIAGSVVGFGWIVSNYLSEMNDNQMHVWNKIAVHLREDNISEAAYRAQHESTVAKVEALIAQRLDQFERRLDRIESTILTPAASSGLK